jgi:integrase
MRRWKRLNFSQRFLIEWNDEPVKRINKAFRSVRRDAGLGEDVVPHTLRHTAITWQAQEGVPVHEICGFFGITRDVFEEVYGHHHPDYQSEAVNALSRRRRNSAERNEATKREHSFSNVMQIAGKH